MTKPEFFIGQQVVVRTSHGASVAIVEKVRIETNSEDWHYLCRYPNGTLAQTEDFKAEQILYCLVDNTWRESKEYKKFQQAVA